MPRPFVLLPVMGLVLFCSGWVAPPAWGEEVRFSRDIKPIFQARCYGCHQPAKAGGGYVMSRADTLHQGGESEQAAIVPGDPDASYLVEQITAEDGVATMPQNGEPLSPRQVELIRQWISEGAADDTPADAPQRYDTDHPPLYTRPPVITSLDYSPDGTLLAIAGFHEVFLYRVTNADPESGEQEKSDLVARLIGISERIESIRFSPDGQKLAVTGGLPARMGEVQIWDVATRELDLSLPITFDTVYGASWSPDSKLLAFGCTDNTIRVIACETGEEVLFQGAHSDWALGTTFSVDGSHLASVSRDATAKLIEVPTQRFVDNITSITPGALRGGINAVVRHPLRDEILFGGADGTPKIYRMHRQTRRVIGDDANLLWELPPLPGRIFSVDFSQDGHLIAAASSLNGHGHVHVYTMEPEPPLPKEIEEILFKPTHERNDEEQKQLAEHFAHGVKTVAELSFNSGGLYAVSIRPDGERVAVAGADGQIRLVDGQSGSLAHEFPAIELMGDTAAEPQPGSADETATVASVGQRENDRTLSEEQLPQGAEVVELVIQPAAIELNRSTAYVQTIVSAKLSTGDLVDVTRIVKLETTAPEVKISNTGLVSVTGDTTTTLTVSLADQSATIPVTATGIDSPLLPDFMQDVSPILARTGCNGGTCHGAQDGKNGFKLSLRGYDPLGDVRALSDDLASRRINLAAAEQSLMLMKPTARLPHKGGQVISVGSDYYRTLLAWIKSGASLNVDSPRVQQMEIQPLNPVVQTIGSRQQLRVVATFTNGQKRDVTREAFVESADTEIAKPVVGQNGLIEVLRRGEAPVLVRYEGAYAATTLTVMGDRSGFVWQQPPTNNRIDALVHAKLKRTQTTPSPICDDYTFLRRVYLDLTGLPPTLEQIDNFISDSHDSRWKRDQLIDQLVGNPEYIEHWTNKWADLLQVNSKFLGREGAESFRNWIRAEVKANTPYDKFAHKLITATGSTKENPASSYFKILREPETTMENTTHLFLATRFNCNKCHDHPFEKWTQDQYYQLSAFFARVGLKKDPASQDKKIAGTAVESSKPLYEVVFTKPKGEVKHLRTGEISLPEFPFECEHECGENATRRERLAAWITSPDNSYFARSYANRIWAYLTGRGLIDPIDDIRAGNPPTNPELLEWLTRQFIESGFDVQNLVRIICRSRTYQLALASNRFNEDDLINYSHAQPRRLPAEVLYDAIYHTTGAPSSFPGLPPGTRAASLPDVGIQLPDGFLNNLGRPARQSACECERTNELQMGPVMALINGATVGDAVSHSKGTIAELVADQEDDRKVIEKLFLRILNRPAVDDEITDTLEVIGRIDSEHEQILTQLEQHEQQSATFFEKRDQQRVEELSAKKAELVEHEVQIVPERKRLVEQRENRIADAKAALAAAKTSLVEKQPAWEELQKTLTVWRNLNPLEVTSTYGTTFSVHQDRSVLVTGPDGPPGSHHLIARTELSDITGIRLEALTDDQLPKRGPGRAENGTFVLTEIKLETSPQFATSRPLIRTWDFPDSTEGWLAKEGTTLTIEEGRLTLEHEQAASQLFVATSAPAGPLALEITAKLAAETKLSVWWQTATEPDFENGRSVSRKVSPGNQTWRTYRIYFEPKSPVTMLRIDLEGGGKKIPLDAIRLVQSSAPEFTEDKLQNAQADFSQEDRFVEEAIDGKIKGNENGWGISPQTGRDHVAIFETSEAYAAAGDGLLRVKMFHNHDNGTLKLGRFRISVTNSPRPISFGVPERIFNLVNLAADQRSSEQKADLLNYYLLREQGYLDHQKKVTLAEAPVPPDAKAEELKKQVAELNKPVPIDPKLARLRRAAELSTQQLAQKRLTMAQDIAWALINSPEFLYNH